MENVGESYRFIQFESKNLEKIPGESRIPSLNIKVFVEKAAPREKIQPEKQFCFIGSPCTLPRAPDDKTIRGLSKVNTLLIMSHITDILI